MKHASLVVATALVLVLSGPAAHAAGPGEVQREVAAGAWTLIGWNDLGMHCMDADYSVFSILPPYNTIHAQLLDPSGDLVTSPGGITVTYEAVADPDGSINTTSAGKTGFWDWVGDLFGVALAVDEGLAGSDMPGATNTPQPMHFEDALDWFTAEGIPLTPYDDAHDKNYYPLMRLVARDGSGQVLATTRIVLPVSDEMTCISCHGSGSAPAAMPSGGWIGDADPERDYRLNILLLHDDLEGGSPTFDDALATAGYNALGLYATVTADGTPILCDSCHASNALPGTGMAGIPALTRAVHTGHAAAIDPRNGMTLDSSDNRAACYTCHPGSETRCLRGAMGNAVASDGSLAMQCQSCHGSMSRVGAADRAGWFDEPVCQSCHTGTATHNNGRIRYTSVFSSSGDVRVAVDHTFATDPDTPAPGVSLFRFSTGHGGVQCEGCHGSTHAIYPSSHLNDNLQSIDLQGHVGTLVECATCHGSQPETVSGGPHGMHPVGQSWVGRHEDAAEHDPSACRACHGADYRGTVLSRSQADRTLSTEFGTKHFWRGFQIGCYTCHNGPYEDEHTSNRPPVVTDATASTTSGSSAALALVASDPDGDPLELRVVSQPTNGTVGLVGTTATYFAPDGFSGTESFTFAAWDGSTDSNLGTGTVTVGGGGGVCTVDCTAQVPASVAAGAGATFSATATASSCAGSVTYAWDFGDGTTGTGSNASHVYPLPGPYTWALTTASGTATCVRTGTIEVVPGESQCQLECRAEVKDRNGVGGKVTFHGEAEGEGCDGAPTLVWGFGDGSSPATGDEVDHRYTAAGSYDWELVATLGEASCESAGTIEIVHKHDPRD